MYLGFDHWFWLIPAVMVGACIGSFLNVVIYRVPLGMSVNEPKRSFCPGCKKQLTMMQNLPVLSWLFLRGKCGYCGGRIAVRYLLVEVLTAILFGVVWWMFPVEAVVFLWVLVALLLVVSWIDAEHMIIPTVLTWGGAVVGLVGCVVWPQMSAMAAWHVEWKDALMGSVIGWVAGYVGLWLVVEMGKKAFGKRDLKFEKEVEWFLKEPESDQEALCFVIDGEEIAWWDVFSRPSDRMVVDASEVVVDGKKMGGGVLVIRDKEIELADGRKFEIEKMVSLSGKARGVVIPREAMGKGDGHLLGMVGAFFGWSGVCFSLFAASIIAIVAAVIGRIGFGKQLPFGPFIAMGAMVWMFGGWKWWQAYVEFLGF